MTKGNPERLPEVSGRNAAKFQDLSFSTTQKGASVKQFHVLQLTNAQTSLTHLCSIQLIWGENTQRKGNNDSTVWDLALPWSRAILSFLQYSSLFFLKPGTFIYREPSATLISCQKKLFLRVLTSVDTWLSVLMYDSSSQSQQFLYRRLNTK